MREKRTLVERVAVAAVAAVAWMAGVAGAAEPASTRPATAPADASMAQDVAALTRAPHRLSGTAAGRAAGDYIAKRLRAMGLEPLELEFPVWQTEPKRCVLEIDGRTVPLLPARPNVTVPPVTPEGGLTGPLLYAGDGDMEDYGKAEVAGAIVAIDYDCGDQWLRAFAMGAKAVIFLADGATPAEPKHVPGPANLVRLYAPESTLAKVDLRRDREQVTVHSSVRWRETTGRTIAAVVPGTAPAFAQGRVKDEALVLAAHYDTFGEVPRRSPGARGAANVAALLHTAERFAADPPKRDTVFAFFDNKARYHAGARRFYEAAMMPDSVHKRLREDHETELAQIKTMRKLVNPATPSLSNVPGVVRHGCLLLLVQEADSVRTAVKQKRKKVNLAVADAKGERKEKLESKSEKLTREIGDWATIRRLLERSSVRSGMGSLYQNLLEAARQWRKAARHRADVHNPDAKYQRVVKKVKRLCEDVMAIIDRRREELERQQRMDRQRAALRRRLAGNYLAMHIDYNFSDGGTRWGPVVSDSLQRVFRGGSSDADNPGYYTQLMQAFRNAAEAVGPEHRPAPAALSDPRAGNRFVPASFAASGSIAGNYQIHNVSLMTGYDAHRRAGHPADTTKRLELQAIKKQARDATATLRALSNEPAAGLNRQFQNLAARNYPRWSEGSAAGLYAGLKMTGSLREDQPARGLVMALWPGGQTAGKAFSRLNELDVAPGFDPFVLTPTDENGRFALVGVRSKGRFRYMGALGMGFDAQGRAEVVSSTDSLPLEWKRSSRVDVVPVKSHSLVLPLMSRPEKVEMRVLRARANAEFTSSSSLVGRSGRVGFFYTPRFGLADRVKVFAEKGPVMLGITKERPIGKGYPLARFATSPPPALKATSEDLWRLNEMRLARLRGRVSNPDLERIHARARQLLRRAGKRPGSASDAQRAADAAKARAKSRLEKEAALGRSVSLSRRVYGPVRASLNDLVHAVIILLLLAIPFAFALERLLICGTSVYARISGFVLMFALTFIVLFLSHPGFSVATTPIMILLAFTIILLTSLVIFIVVRRFRAELQALHGQSAARHQISTSGTGTLLAAVGMGMSTMRRRPLRTTLTAITAIMLTFTVLCFASLTRQLGVKSSYEGPVPSGASSGLLIRHLGYEPVLPDVLTVLRGGLGDQADVFGQWWHVRKTTEDPPLPVTGADRAEAVLVQGAMGVAPGDARNWPALLGALGSRSKSEKIAALEGRGVFLPPIVRDRLQLKPGDPVTIAGHEARFAGVLDGKRLRALQQLDGRSALPVDFQEIASGQRFRSQEESGGSGDSQLVQKSFKRLGPNEVAVASRQLVKELGGDLYGVRVRTGPERDPLRLGRDLARQLEATVWARGAEGVQRLNFGTITQVRGSFALVVPVVLGGLIIFGTLLGSITDRAREIYTFSALGLSPAHVGFLFFAEAGVYAVVGGLGGQLLAQGVALGANQLAEWGYIQAPSINYSSTNALFAIAIVMATVLVSAVYPAMKAGRSANPGVQRRWQMPAPEGDELSMTFPFTVSAYDITGVIGFLAEHFRSHDDAGVGAFAAGDVRIHRDEEGRLSLSAELALAPFDLGVTQRFTLTAVESEIPGVDEVLIRATRRSGTRGDWTRGNRAFVQELRKQFLLWRTLSTDAIEAYRMRTLEELGEQEAQPAGGDADETEAPA